MISGIRDMQCAMESELQLGLNVPHVHKDLTLSEVREEEDMQKNLHWVWLLSNPRPSA